MALKKLSLLRWARAAAAVILVLAAVRVSGQDDDCVSADQACSLDSDCLACKNAVTTNLEGFELCQLNYGYEERSCVNQSAQPCCQDNATSIDCLSNEPYMDFYGCRLANDVFEEECATLDCSAVGGLIDYNDTILAESGAGRPAPGFLLAPGGGGGGVGGGLVIITTVMAGIVSVVMVAASAAAAAA